MFFYIVNKLLTQLSNDENKMDKVIIIGTLCYVILHGFLYSLYNSTNQLISKYKYIIYYIFSLDVIITSTSYFIYGNKKKAIEEVKPAQIKATPENDNVSSKSSSSKSKPKTPKQDNPENNERELMKQKLKEFKEKQCAAQETCALKETTSSKEKDCETDSNNQKEEKSNNPVCDDDTIIPLFVPPEENQNN